MINKTPRATAIETLDLTPEMTTHLQFLDGVRGLSALYVLVSHSLFQSAEGLIRSGQKVPSAFQEVLNYAPSGSDAVAVFLVLSGYCLMHPVIRSGSSRLPGGLLHFIHRRSLRILPPYYAALALAIASICFGAFFKHATGITDGDKNAAVALTTGNLISHVLLLHNWSKTWSAGVEPPMWSISVEWQIYFVFSMILLPLWRKVGILPCVLGAFVVGMAPHFLLPYFDNFDWMRPWMLGIFALGMLGATITFGTDAQSVAVRQKTPWAAISILLTLITYGVISCFLRDGRCEILIHPLVGLIAMSTIVYCVQHLRSGQPSGVTSILTLFQSKFAIGIGDFSYSLYLIHGLVITRVRVFTQKVHFHGPEYLIVSLFLDLTLSLLLAYGFHLIFERPFRQFKNFPVRVQDHPGRYSHDSTPSPMSAQVRFHR